MLRHTFLWKNFQQEENSREDTPRAVCKACATFLKRSDGSPSLMKEHTKKYHPDLNKEYLMMVTKTNREMVKLM
jgi:hypothetical protein